MSSVLADSGGATTLTVNQIASQYGQLAPGTAAATYPSVILTNSNTYTGVTTVDLGVLQLGNGATNGLLTGTSQITAPDGQQQRLDPRLRRGDAGHRLHAVRQRGG